MKKVVGALLFVFSLNAQAQTIYVLQPTSVQAGTAVPLKVMASIDGATPQDQTSLFSFSYPFSYKQLSLISLGSKTSVFGNIVGSTSITVSRLSDPTDSFSSPIQIIPGSPAKLSLVSGNNQSAVVGQSYISSLVVKVVDKMGNPVPNYPINWSTAPPSTSLSDSSGLASLVLWTGSAGNQLVQASTSTPISGLGSVTFSETALPPTGSAYKLVFATQPDSAASSGSALTRQPRISVRDSSGAPVDATVDVTLSAYGNSTCTIPATGNVSGGTTTTQRGTAYFSTLQYDKAETIYFKATSGSLISACSSYVKVENQSTGPAKLVFIQLPNVGTVNKNLFIAPRIAIKDNLNKTVYAIASGTATIAAYSDSSCSTPVSLGGTRNVHSLNGYVTFSAIQPLTSGSLYLKAYSDALDPAFLSSDCSSLITVTAPCSSGQHSELNVCVSNSKSCSESNGSGTKNWTGSTYGPCVLSSCDSGFDLVGGSCLASFVSPSLQNLDVWVSADTAWSLNNGIPVANGGPVTKFGPFTSIPGATPPVLRTSPRLDATQYQDPTFLGNEFNGYSAIDFNYHNGQPTMTIDDYSNHSGSFSMTIAFSIVPGIWSCQLRSDGYTAGVCRSGDGSLGGVATSALYGDPSKVYGGLPLNYVTVNADAATNIATSYVTVNGITTRTENTNYGNGSPLSLIDRLYLGEAAIQVSEVLIYSVSKSDAEIRSLHRYLKNKYTNANYAKNTLKGNFGCAIGKHLAADGISCEFDTVNCSSPPANVTEYSKKWEGPKYGVCAVRSCDVNFIVNNSKTGCVSTSLPSGAILNVNSAQLLSSGLTEGVEINTWSNLADTGKATVDKWGDFIFGNSEYLLPGTHPYFSTNSLSWVVGSPVVVFPPNSQLTWLPAKNIGKNYTVISVFSMVPVAYNYSLIWGPGYGGMGGYAFRSDFVAYNNNIDFGTNESPQIDSLSSNETTATGYRFGAVSPSITSDSVSMDGKSMNLISFSGTNNFAEVIVYDRELTAGEMEQVRAYMVKTYGNIIVQ